MARKCLYLLLAGVLLQMPALARADTPEEQIEKLKKELLNARREIEKLSAERDALRKEMKDLEERYRTDLAERLRKEKKDREERTKRLMEDVERMAKENRLLSPDLPGQQLWDPPPLPELNIPKPPRDEREGANGGVIKGTITAVADNLATISIGSDQGVKLDQIFQVYRLTPDPAYLGTLKITNVESGRAAGRFTPATKSATMQKGDTVDWKVSGAEKNKDNDEEMRRLIGENEKLRLVMQPFFSSGVPWTFSSDELLLPGQQLWDPPPRYMLRTPIRGSITGVADDLAIISIGSDHGIEVDQVLNVYRLEPTPESLGTLKITIVDAHRAAGRFTPATKNATMQKGDKVRTSVADGEKSWD